ncbi:MAG: DUF1428 domain-containing protein, partial [Pseudomonadota bacterium]
MGYVDVFVAAVPDGNRDAYLAHATRCAEVFKAHGALEVSECWGEEVPDGELTSFPLAVKKAEGETVVVGWVSWPSKAARDEAWPKVMAAMTADGEMEQMPFDG